MKKAFTIVELSIVLVVIGLLLGMGLKGTELIESARIKSDIAKISKIRSAFVAYYAKYNTMPGKRAGSNVLNSKDIYEDLTGEGFLAPVDFQRSSKKTYAGVNGGQVAYYGFVGCGATGTNSNYAKGLMGPRGVANSQPNVCVFESGTAPGSYNSNNYNAAKPVLLKDICLYETNLDDNNIKTGDGRLAGSASATLSGRNCYKEKDTDSAEYVIRVY